MDDPRTEHLRRALTTARDAMRWKLEGLSEYDARRPLTPTGSNILGVVKHVASVELGYLGDVFGRPSGVPLPWLAPDAEPNADMWVPPEESRQSVLRLLDAAAATTEGTLAALDLDAPGEVPWWGPDRRRVTLHEIAVHMIAESHRHAGHVDVLRELVDGQAGYRPDNDNLAPGDAAWWADYVARVQAAADLCRD